MRFSDEFETRFAEMLTHYPTRRSALVPTLLYAQDEVGRLSDEVIADQFGRQLGHANEDVEDFKTVGSVVDRVKALMAKGPAAAGAKA